MDGTARPVCRPKVNQRAVCNGRNRVHSLKFQSVVAPNGLIANLFSPVEGRRHDAAMLVMSGLLDELEEYSYALRPVPTGGVGVSHPSRHISVGTGPNLEFLSANTQTCHLRR